MNIIILLSLVFIILGFLSNLIGILINPISILVAIPFALYVAHMPYEWGYFLLLCYYIGLFLIGPFLLKIPDRELPLLIHSKLVSVVIFTLIGVLPFSIIIWWIQHFSG